MSYTFKFEVIVTVSVSDPVLVRTKIGAAIDRMLDNASFLSEKSEVLESITLLPNTKEDEYTAINS